MSVLEQMFARTGKQWNQFRSGSAIGTIVQRQGVPISPEFERIHALPRRSWSTLGDLPFLQREMSNWLMCPGGTQTLRPVQAAALAELHDFRALLAPISVGAGKTHISFLAPRVVDAEISLLLIPANLRQKTKIEFDRLAHHWLAPTQLAILSYQQLGRSRFENFLEDLCPDLVISDEVHWLRNLGAACTKRVRRYMEAYPETKFVGMSGTITKRSLMDFHHMLLWTLGRERMPLPVEPSEARRWACAVDAKVPVGMRMKPGVLTEFMESPPKGDLPSLEEVRGGLASRIMGTPGIVASLTDDADASLHIHFYEPELPDEVVAAMEEIVATGESLNGDIVLSAVEYWRHMRELSCGFYSYWVDKPPREWMTCRQKWFGYQRKILEQDYEGLDSPLQVTNAVAQGRLNSGGLYQMWKDVEDSFKPVTEARWISTDILKDVLEKTLRHPTLIWVEHVPVGEKLRELSPDVFGREIRLFNRAGVDQFKTPIDTLENAETIILSIGSNKEGRNLQNLWSRNHLVSPPPNGAIWEQIMGRTHRLGQEENQVVFEVAIGHRLVRNGMVQAYIDAQYISEITRKRQKLLLADTSGMNIKPRIE